MLKNHHCGVLISHTNLPYESTFGNFTSQHYFDDPISMWSRERNISLDHDTMGHMEKKSIKIIFKVSNMDFLTLMKSQT